MEDRLIEIVESLGYEVYRQGSLSENDDYPKTFFTYWNSDSPNTSFYDNNEHGTIWMFDVNVYSIDSELAYKLLLDARSALKQNGFIVTSKGYDLTTDEPTHTGRGMEVIFIEY